MMHPGSGPSDRDNDILFPPIRTAVLARHVAVCSFDKRGVGASGGDWTRAGIPTQAQDLLAGLDAARSALAAQGHEPPAGLFGHSQGGWVVLEAAASADVRFVITNSGPAVSPAEQELHSTRMRLGAAGWSAADAEDALTLLGQIFTLAGTGHSLAEAAALRQARDDLVTRMVRNSVFVPDDPDLWAYAGLIFPHDPSRALQALCVPLLALLGQVDDVVPVERSASVFRALVSPDLLDVRIVEGGDHRLQRPGSEEFVPGYLDTVAGFAAARFETPPTTGPTPRNC